MILHLVDDEKIINRTINLFDNASNKENKFLVEIPDVNYKLKYINEVYNTHLAVYDSPRYWDIVGDINEYSAIIIHYLSPNKCRFIKRFAHLKINFVWILWGKDLYTYLSEVKGYKLFLWRPSIFSSNLRYLFPYRRVAYFKHLLSEKIKKDSFKALYEKAFNRIDYCAIFNKGDYNLLLKHTTSSAKWLWFNYYPIDEILGPGLMNESVIGDNIIIGNSGSFSGNHIPALKTVSSLNIGSRKVIVPISYGEKVYCDFVEKEGKRILGNNFVPLRNFMSLLEYNKLLFSASIVIMYQLRQEAVGNLLISLYLGAKVYLREENNLYDYFRSIGVKVFSIQKDLNSNNSSVLEPLSESEQLQNRERILAEFNQDKIIHYTKLLLLEAAR